MSDIDNIVERHGFPKDAGAHMLHALARGNGQMAQFNHPAFGGMGQWHAGGMLMIGDMFNEALKARVAALCRDLAPHIAEAKPDETERFSSARWQQKFGSSSSAGSQNSMQYAVYPEARRLVVQIDGREEVYDTGNHRIQGVPQQQGSGQDLTFSTSTGAIRISELQKVSAQPDHPAATSLNAEPSPHVATADSDERQPTRDPGRDEIAMIERLHELHKKGVLSNEEFAEKKRDLLSRI